MPFSPFKVIVIMNTSFYTMKLFVYYILAGLITYKTVNALQILAIECIPARSHWNFMSAIKSDCVSNLCRIMVIMLPYRLHIKMEIGATTQKSI